MSENSGYLVLVAGFFLEGLAKPFLLEGLAKLCFSLICGKLLGKCHFQGCVFAASYRGNCNFGVIWEFAFLLFP